MITTVVHNNQSQFQICLQITVCSCSTPIKTTMSQPVPTRVVDAMVFAPDFWPIDLPNDIDALKNLQKHLESSYKGIEWLPQELIDEIKSLYPASTEIDDNMDGQRCQLAFSAKVTTFFYPGRVFLNYKQFVAAGQFFLDAWAVSSCHGAKSLSCYYGAPRGKALSINDPTKRKQMPSPKTMSCPFRVSCVS